MVMKHESTSKARVTLVVPVSQGLLSCKSNMASLPFVGTLESDDDVDQLDNESDSDEEPEKVYRHDIYT